MHSNHPLQRFLDRHGLSQSELARTVRISRETVNRWIHRHNQPVGQNLLRTVEFAKRFEPRVEAHELFPRTEEPQICSSETGLDESWGDACAICRVPWNEATEHLPLALLHPEIGADPAGDLCPVCARRTGSDPTEPLATLSSNRTGS